MDISNNIGVPQDHLNYRHPPVHGLTLRSFAFSSIIYKIILLIALSQAMTNLYSSGYPSFFSNSNGVYLCLLYIQTTTKTYLEFWS
jgi:hypothetical protein